MQVQASLQQTKICIILEKFSKGVPHLWKLSLITDYSPKYNRYSNMVFFLVVGNYLCVKFHKISFLMAIIVLLESWKNHWFCHFSSYKMFWFAPNLPIFVLSVSLLLSENAFETLTLWKYYKSSMEMGKTLQIRALIKHFEVKQLGTFLEIFGIFWIIAFVYKETIRKECKNSQNMQKKY